MPARIRRNSSRRAAWAPARGLEVSPGGGRSIEQREAESGLEEPLGVGERPEPGIGRHDVAREVLAPDAAVAVAVLRGEQAGPVEVEERRQGALGEAVDVGSEAPRDMVVAEPSAHHVGVLALDQRVVVRAPGAGLGEPLDAQLVEQSGDAVVDVLAAVVGVEAEDGERERQQQALEQRQQEALGDADDGADELVLGDLVDQVDQVQALDPVAVALVDGVDAHEAGPAFGPRRLPQANRRGRRARLKVHEHPEMMRGTPVSPSLRVGHGSRLWRRHAKGRVVCLLRRMTRRVVPPNLRTFGDTAKGTRSSARASGRESCWLTTKVSDQSDPNTRANGGMPRLKFDCYPRTRRTHYLFRYPAKFHPPVARKLIEDFSDRGDLILDPYCGSGTLLVEALHSGRSSIGVDIDPVATFVSHVKTLWIPVEPLRRSSERLSKALGEAERPATEYDRLKWEDLPTTEFEDEVSGRNLILPEIPNLSHWFRRYVTVDLGTILSQIEQTQMPKRHRLFFRLVFASIIRRASNADPVPVSGLEVTSHMRKLEKEGRRINPFDLFRRAASRGLKDWEKYEETRRGCECTVDVKQRDAIQLPKHVRRSVDAIITSPPYHQAVDYYRRHTLEMYWLGFVRDRGDRLRLRTHYIGRHGVRKSERMVEQPTAKGTLAGRWEAKLHECSEARAMAFRHYVNSMTKCVEGMAKVLKRGGKAVFVVGKNTTSGGVTIPSTEIFDEIVSARLELRERYWYPVKNRYMTYARRNGANIDKEYVLVYEREP